MPFPAPANFFELRRIGVRELQSCPVPLPTSIASSPKSIDRLKSLGIRTSDKLLDAAKSLRGRKILAAKTGIDEKSLLRLANKIDRMRVKGIGQDYAKLLQIAGVDTVRELKYRNPRRLAEAMAEANATAQAGPRAAVRTHRRALDRACQEAAAEDQLLKGARRRPSHLPLPAALDTARATAHTPNHDRRASSG